ncbi:DUF4328 domain-containing protein [Kitasatospora sp. NPDC087861]|uniref:DUF4328 domain-containing protein n=1 Tax=unclassified Kitasatospora TaxID=2633591 RepID=UPI0024770722|nr:DUF4328 domain-containing protein [Kitasatospora sp. MAA19]
MGTESGRCFGCTEATPGWLAAYRSANGLAVAVFVLLGLSAAVSAWVVVIDLWSDTILGRLLDGSGDVGADEVASLGTLATGVNTFSIVVMLATAVVFIRWFHRVRQNADLLVPNGHRLGRGWTIGSWFTPIVLLWFPWQLMVDCWQASAPLDADGRRPTLSQRVLVLWWSTWIGSLLVGWYAYSVLKSVHIAVDGSLEELRSAVRVETAGAALRLVAAVAAIVVVHRLTAMQQARRAHVNPIAARAAQLAAERSRARTDA